MVAVTPAERWASLPAATRDAIGAKLLESHFAELVRDDDGLETTEVEREEAGRIQDEAFSAIFPLIEDAFPTIMWSYPGPVTYVARDSHGNSLGVVGHAGMDKWRFVPVSPHMKLGRVVWGIPTDALPLWVHRAIRRGGWFGAVFDDGRRYPDDFPQQTCAVGAPVPVAASAARL
ncbi:hypothetical protein P7D22_13575 [Lichenihabitans sp. Uapishka_5]|uniref:hypothetical protein n=1 Tax=Lichenihabitans sp. Uapishka_5 TaxID=3037302 RepID=UPI0029E7D531|nr:hypothetical protein [Lichenihabitans sp. Uapishka_5]MDX7952205.1 hypothetical protein [Lichenihabitans sp. Uapishka_5]